MASFGSSTYSRLSLINTSVYSKKAFILSRHKQAFRHHDKFKLYHSSNIAVAGRECTEVAQQTWNLLICEHL